MMTPFEQRGFDRIVDAGLRFANRSYELEYELAQVKHELAQLKRELAQLKRRQEKVR